MININRIIILLIIIILISCEDNRYFTDCTDCTANEPVDVVLKAELDNDFGNGIIVMLWNGTLEDNILVDSIRTYGSSFEKRVPVNRLYTVTATYLKNSTTYTVVNSTMPKVAYTSDLCDQPCYYLYDDKVSLHLKYTK